MRRVQLDVMLGIWLLVGFSPQRDMHAQQGSAAASALAVPPVLAPGGGPVLLLVYANDVRRAERDLDADGGVGCTDASARATDARGLGIWKSGGFTAGAFSAYRTTWYQGGGKLWFTPGHPDTTVALNIRMIRLSEPRATFTFRERHLAFAQGTGARFYATNLRLASTGNWLLVLRAGVDVGCFLYRL